MLKVFVAAFYGVEAARIAPRKVVALAAAVIDAFRSRNDDHNACMFYATFTDEDKDLDPIVQITGRRILQIRRVCSKDPIAQTRYKRMLEQYAEKACGWR